MPVSDYQKCKGLGIFARFGIEMPSKIEFLMETNRDDLGFVSFRCFFAFLRCDLISRSSRYSPLKLFSDEFPKPENFSML
jgi:hypothetical protein